MLNLMLGEKSECYLSLFLDQPAVQLLECYVSRGQYENWNTRWE